MKLVFTLLTIALNAALSAEPLNPPAPELQSIIRSKTHAELTWIWEGAEREVDAFQVNRRLANGTHDQSTVIGIQKVHVTPGPRKGTIRCQWVAKKLDADTPYLFSVMVFCDDGTSLESNALLSVP